MNKRFYALYTLLFIVLYIFFIKILWVIPYNGDDWHYIAQFRTMLPTIDEWNPARVFPEVLSPLFGYFNAYVMFPIIGDYLDAFIISNALMMAAFITMLCVAINRVIFGIWRDGFISVAATLFFICSAFVMFKSGASGNVNLFYGFCFVVNTYYVCPNIFNSIILLGFIYTQYSEEACKKLENCGYAQLGVYVLLIYLAQFSMTTSSFISCSYASVALLYKWLNSGGNFRQKSRNYIMSASRLDMLMIFAVLCWMIAAVMDSNGMRFSALDPEAATLRKALGAFWGLASKTRELLLVLSILILGVSLGIYLRKRFSNNLNQRDRDFIAITCMLLSSSTLCLLLGVAVSARAMVITDDIRSMYNFFFMLLICISFCMAYVLSSASFTKIAIPFLILFLFVETSNTKKNWATGIYSTAGHRAIVENWLDAAARAEKAGLSSFEIAVPALEWPHSEDYFPGVLSKALYIHGITSRRMNITMREDKSLLP